MTTLRRHIGMTVLLAIGGAAALISSLDFVFSFADELTYTDENYSVSDALVFVLLTMPANIYTLSPFAGLVGALIGLGVLASHNELVAMRAAGVSVWRIVGAALGPTALLAVAAVLLGEYAVPPLDKLARDRHQLAADFDADEAGVWRKIDNTYFHIDAIDRTGENLRGVSRYQLSEERVLTSASFAARARFVAADAPPAPAAAEDSPDGTGYWLLDEVAAAVADGAGNDSGYWLLEDVRETRFSPQRISQARHETQRWQVDLSPRLLSVLTANPDSQSLGELLQFAAFLDSQGIDSSRYYLSFWKKVLQPLATLLLVLLAASFVFGPLREATTGYRVFIGIVIGLAFTIGQRLLEPTSLLFGFSPVIAAALPIALCGAVAVALLRRIR